MEIFIATKINSSMKYNHEKLEELQMPICQCKSINTPSSANRYDEDNLIEICQILNNKN